MTGLESLHQMTSEGRWELRVDLGDWDGSTAFATYSDFLIADETDGYRLRYGNFTGGTAGKPSFLRRNLESLRKNMDSLCDKEDFFFESKKKPPKKPLCDFVLLFPFISCFIVPS